VNNEQNERELGVKDGKKNVAYRTTHFVPVGRCTHGRRRARWHAVDGV
jgi:hypothetical protein